MIQRFAFYLFLIPLVLVSTFLMLKITIPYFSFEYDIDFLLTKQNVLYLKIWRYSFYTHISCSLIVLFTGVFQFVKKIQIEYKSIHRKLGFVYLFLVLLVCAPSGTIMAIYANGGILSKTSFLITSILWWIFTFNAFLNIKQKNIQKHEANMIRSYALTLSAVSLRLYVLILPHFIHLHAQEMYTLVAWMSWIPNILFAEFIIRRKLIIE